MDETGGRDRGGETAGGGAPPRARPGRLQTAGVALLLLVLLLGALEGLLRLAPLERWEPRFSGPQPYPIFVRGEGSNAGRYVTNEHYRHELNFQSFPVEKAPGTVRVFVLGGSAAYGWPVGAKFGFTGILRRALEQALPGRFEIVNAAGMSYGSLRVLDFLREIVRDFQPDLVLVYAGNNEYVERNALPAGDALPPALLRARDRLRASALYRGLRLLLVRAAPGRFSGRGALDLSQLRATPVQRGNLVRSAETDRAVLAAYRRNLQEMADTLRRAGVAGVFCTVPVNLADWPPAGGAAPRAAPPLAAARAALERGDAPAALEHLAAARALAPDDAAVWFWTGRALRQAGDPGAAAAFDRARDADPNVMRALGAFNREIRALPAGRSGIAVLDLERAFAEASPGGVPGAELFLDYVHETQEGHRLVALALLPVLARRFDGPWPADALARLVSVDPGPGADPVAHARERYARALGLQQNERWAEAQRGFEEVLHLTGDFRAEVLVNLADVVETQGDRERAEALYREAAAAGAGNGPVLQQVALYHLGRGRADQAEPLLREALRLNPLYPLAHEGLARIALARGDARAAEEHLAAAAALGLDTAATRRTRGAAALALGRRAEAIAHWERALALDPEDEETRGRLAALRGEAP
jgi:tetratricopeptide (TPR) repeat protein